MTSNPNDVSAYPGNQSQTGVLAKSEQSEQLEQEVSNLATETYNNVSHRSEDFRKLLCQRLIEIHNATAKQESKKLLLQKQGDFQTKYPKLNQWIENKLGFISSDIKLANLAFASGRFADFLEARDNFRSNVHKMKCEFFRKYFQENGTKKGFTELSKIIDFITKYDIGRGPWKGQLEEARTGLDEETVEESSSSSRSSNGEFNYLAALRVVHRLPDGNASALAEQLGIEYNDLTTIRTENGYDLTLTFMVVFHRASTDNNKSTDDLVNAMIKANIGGLTGLLNVT